MARKPQIRLNYYNHLRTMKTIALQKQKKRTDYQTDPYQSNQKLNSQYHNLNIEIHMKNSVTLR